MPDQRSWGKPVNIPSNSVFDEAYLHALPVEMYWKMVHGAVDEVERGAPTPDGWTLHEAAFARAALLLMSPLGGWCWPKAGRDVCALTMAQLAPLIDGTAAMGVAQSVLHPRSGLDYPVFQAPIVTYALLALVALRMGATSIRNNALATLPPAAYLAPVKAGSKVDRPDVQIAHRLGLLKEYLCRRAQQAGCLPEPTLKTYLGVGRLLLSRQYSMEVASALLGVVETSPPESGQMREPEFLRNVVNLCRLEAEKPEID